MTPTEDRARQVIRRICGDRPDDDVVMIEVGALLAALRVMDEHVNCEDDMHAVREEGLAEQAKRIDELEARESDLVDAIEEAVTKLRGAL